MTHNRTVRAGVAATLLAFTVGFAWAEVSPSNKWRLEFSGSADSDGVIELKITPVGGEDMLAGVNISKRTSENKVAQAVVDALRAQLPEESYHIERDDGEDVLIKKKRGAENFAVEIVYNSVEGVRISPQHE